MKKFITALTALFLTACSTAPVIVPDTTTNNVVMKKLNYEITNSSISCSWGWILWYLPIVAAVMIWMWRKFIKECPDCEKAKNEPKTLNG
jgi:hypothetical protein